MSPLKIETNLEPSKDKTEDKSPPTKNIGGLLFGGFAGGGVDWMQVTTQEEVMDHPLLVPQMDLLEDSHKRYKKDLKKAIW